MKVKFRNFWLGTCGNNLYVSCCMSILRHIFFLRFGLVMLSIEVCLRFEVVGFGCNLGA